ncbi:MAG: hypothetical protein ACKO27_01575 [Ilumatobacteraceae bacterium]
MTASITVSPSSFVNVAFDADDIRRVATSVAGLVGFRWPVAITVDETSPLTRVRIDAGDTVELRIDSGALEDSRHQRQFGEATAAVAIGRALLRAADRLDGGFAAAPPDADLTLAHASAWSAYAYGRLARLGLAVRQQRVRYDFRNRHGFADAVDAAFERIWSAPSMAWDELSALSDSLTKERSE